MVEVVGWLRDNPFEVISIFIGNGDYVDVEDFVKPLKTSGIADMAYIPPPKRILHYDEWPTLEELITMGKRVIVFMDHRADETRVPYILTQFLHMWETKSSPMDDNFTCVVDKPAWLSKDGGYIYMANHNLNVEVEVFGIPILVPDKVNLNRSNAASGGYGTIGLAVEQCVGMFPPPLVRFCYFFVN